LHCDTITTFLDKHVSGRATPTIQTEFSQDLVPVEKARWTVLIKCSHLFLQNTIPDVFSQLKLSGEASQMMYQPGNAYNEHMISAAKITGRHLFFDLDPVARKARINDDIEKIQKIISQTTVERLRALECMKDENTHLTGSDSFAKLDDRLQALAVLMLHYCAALQNCIEFEESSADQNQEVADTSSEFVSGAIAYSAAD
uniref:DUF4371 domain-containing protein n=1 Tax=Gongylonema pulchrum TaxID=637853 RepID=A0A183D175_9BILA